jgi:hypothetical protein
VDFFTTKRRRQRKPQPPSKPTLCPTPTVTYHDWFKGIAGNEDQESRR